MASKPTEKRYIGFYLVEGMWAGSKPDYSSVNPAAWHIQDFSNMMEEIVLSVKRDDREILVARDGLVAYRDKGIGADLSTSGPADSFSRIEDYTEILNALFLVLVSVITEESKIARHTYFEVTHHDIIPLMYEGTKWKGAGIPTKSIASYQLNKRFLSYVPQRFLDMLDQYLDMPPRTVVSEEVLRKAIETFFDIVVDKSSARLVGRTNKALAEYASTAFSDCILISWLQVESYLYQLLEGYMKSQGSQRFNAERRKRLLQDSTVSEVIELLESSGLIDQDLYKLLGQVRRTRNKIVHNNYSAIMDEATKALELAEKIIFEKTGQSLKVRSGLQWQSF